MFQKLKSLFQLFQAGKELKNKATWARGQAYVIPLVVGVLVSCLQLAQAFDIQIPAFLTQETLYWIAGSIYMLVNSAITIFSHKDLGIPTGQLPTGASGEALQTVQESSATGSDQEQPIVPPSPVSGPSSRFDEETLRRATEWVERQKPSYPGPLEGAG